MRVWRRSGMQARFRAGARCMVRNSKRAQFRASKLGDVEHSLDQLRVEKQLGGVIAERTNEQLFCIDRVGSEQVRQRQTRGKPLRLDELVQPQSKISVPQQKMQRKRVVARIAKRTALPAKKERPKAAGPFDLWAGGEARAARSSGRKAGVRAVKTPEPGASYRPDAQSHMDLIQRAVEEETRRQQKLAQYKAAADAVPRRHGDHVRRGCGGPL